MPIPAREPSFIWATGIEDTFIPQAAKTTGRALDEYELTQHYHFWREDLNLAASLGLRWMRYGIPWYRVNPAPGVFDWSWVDKVLERMLIDLRIEPIIDLVHYGCPLWLHGQFGSREYPERVADYAAAFVERYRDVVRYFTPLNEPWMHAYLCGYTAAWPPNMRGWRGWTRLTMGLVKGMSLTIAAVRDLRRDAAVVHVEAASSFIAGDNAGDADVAVWWARRFLATDLIHGWVDEGHPLRGWLLEKGASVDQLEWLCAHPATIDVMGTNFYPGLNVWKVVNDGGATTRKRYYGGTAELETVLRRYYERYRKPIMITETSTPGPVWRRERWMDGSLGVVHQLRREGVPVIGYTWWPMFSLVGWPYRRGQKLKKAYLAHMGLWDLRESGDGTLVRTRTPLVDKYAACLANAAGTVGPLGERPC
ncbi:MAG: family 1 glycosylhydrolase [Actinomycetota bacterium]|nr:family 1 glycosylhydrolase [Actinomycetota bacterium]